MGGERCEQGRGCDVSSEMCREMIDENDVEC